MTKMIPSSDVLAAHLAGEAVLLNLADKSYYRLNETAALVWKEIESGSDRATILKLLLDKYDVAETEASRELDVVLDDMISRKLVALGK